MRSMKLILIGGALMAATLSAQATEYGRVISSVPVVVQQAPSTQSTCWNEQTVVRRPENHGGAVVGGIFGALVGSAFGRGSGNLAATATGAIAGAVAGDSLDKSSGSDVQTVRRCQTTATGSGEQRTMYDVTYEYGGQRYTARMASDPGEWIPVTVSVAPGSDVAPPPQTTVTRETVTVVDDPVVVYRSPVYYDYYYAPPPPVYFGVGIGYHRYWGGGGWGGGFYGRHR